ncbi:hypothetical protein [Gordoniibacillus kamchatkensis]|uniref:hypothetical protein n=1 Tax=Gordoniibacillus kamchatkensis TaxID=1590651 RepID=UPI0012E05304|nr:hypothetical protein [Paenibacillus sp. VKM B-2647]
MWKNEQYKKNIKLERERPVGIPVKVDLTDLIRQVYVQPKSPKWFVDTVKDVLKKVWCQR